MEKLTISRKITSETIKISQLKRFIGKDVEITVREIEPAVEKSANTSNIHSAGGVLSEFANPALVNEEENIWDIVIKEKHGDR